MKYIRVWLQLTKNAFSSFLSNRIDSLSYLLGKFIRFGFFWILLLSLFDHTSTLAGYSESEVLLFFLTFNLIDVLTQAFLRGIYFFHWDVIKGSFDGILTKPINALFHSLFRFSDLLDFIFLIPLLGFLISVIVQIPTITIFSIFLYILLIFIGLVIIVGVHILSAAITLTTNESDNLLWLYREAIGLGRFPPEILSSKLQIVFTYFLPVIVTIAFPVKALLGKLSVPSVFLALIIAILFFSVSLIVWKHSLKNYTSASS